MASREQGYDDERVVGEINDNLRCAICLGVVKHPVMCQQNEHLFCRCCIERHLQNFHTCPTCMDNLTVEILKPVSRMARQMLDKLTIRCDNVRNGCGELLRLEELDQHVQNCWYSPIQCSNEGCNEVILRRGQARHENEVCRFRPDHSRDLRLVNEKLAQINLHEGATKHEVAEIKRSLDEVKASQGETMNAVRNMQRNQEEIRARQDETINAVQKMQSNQEEIRAETMNAVRNMQRNQDAIVEEMRKYFYRSTEEAGELPMAISVQQTDEFNLVIAGGCREGTRLNSVEHYHSSRKSWSVLKTMKKPRSGAASVLFNHQMIISGGFNGNSREDSIETLSVNPVNPSETWRYFPAKLPVALYAYTNVLYNQSLISLGGRDSSGKACDFIYEVMLTPPYETKLLGRLPQKICDHEAVLFDRNKIVVCGGSTSVSFRDSVNSVIRYDIDQNKCEMLAPLPFPVCGMAVVKYNNDLLLIGGFDRNVKVLRSVVRYNIESGRSEMLPDMKYARYGCSAAVVGERIVVMGGYYGSQYLKSVECFTFSSNCWEDMPEMKEARACATAVGW